MTMRLVANDRGLADLQDDLRGIARRSMTEPAALMRRAGVVGNTVAKDNARRSSGSHGKLYPRSFTHESSSYHGGSGSTFQAVYGPDAARPQGGMSFERGSRNQPPHLDLARSADLMGPVVHGEVKRMVDGWFW